MYCISRASNAAYAADTCDCFLFRLNHIGTYLTMDTGREPIIKLKKKMSVSRNRVSKIEYRKYDNKDLKHDQHTFSAVVNGRGEKNK